MTRQRFQFGLKILFVIMAIIAGIGCYYRLQTKRHHTERLVVNRLSEFDSHAEWRFGGPSWLEPVCGGWSCFQRVQSLHIQQPVPKEVVVSMRHLEMLRKLSISFISREELQANYALNEVANLKGLECLHVTGFFTDAAVSNLQSLTEIKHLHIYSVHVSDRGIISLTSLITLEELWLGGMELTMEGLVPLLKLPKLHDLDISGCDSDISDDEATQLRAIRPDVQFIY